MGSTPKSAAHARYHLPANLILSPRELKLYRRWQSLHTTLRPTEMGFIPTAIEYDNFQQWLKKQDSGYFSDVFDDLSEHINTCNSSTEPTIASLCQHSIHPVETGQPRLRCPVCTIDLHMNYMKVLTRSLNGANGRPLPRTGTPSEQQENLYSAWMQGKLATLRQVDELEALSAKEDDWAKSHVMQLGKEVHTARKALELYWSETTDCENIRQMCTSKKSLVFADDTNFLPGRPTDYFLRRSPRYEPGKYSLPNEEQQDDSDISEDSEDYSSARVFALGPPGEAQNLDSAEALGESKEMMDFLGDLQDDDRDSDWEDIDSDEENDESSEGSYICFEEDDEEPNLIVFSDD
ncbi:hypothetical protein ACEQ8H_007663 [Pleosporales sp. CAS-2024a]